MSRESDKAKERAKKIASMSMDEQRAYLESEKRREPEGDTADCAPRTCSARSIEPKMTWEEIKANHRDDIKRQAIMFYGSKDTVFAGERPMKRWTLCVQMIVETWLMLGPQKDHVPTRTIYL